MKFKLEIELGNAAMRNRGHLANALRDVAKAVLDMHKWFHMAGTEHAVMDLNGNKVGHWKLEY